MCRLDDVLKSDQLFPSLCTQRTSSDKNTNTPNQCCPSWSLGHYIAQMTNRSSCTEIDEQDVQTTLDILASCAKHYHALQMSPHCDSIVQEGMYTSASNIYLDINIYSLFYMLLCVRNSMIGSSNQAGGDDCSDVPLVCTRHNAAYHILHFLTDAEFLVDGNRHLRFASLFLPVIIFLQKSNLFLFLILRNHLLMSQHLFVTGCPQYGAITLLLQYKSVGIN